MRSFRAEFWDSCRSVAIWWLLMVAGAFAVHQDHKALGVALVASAGFALFRRGFRFGVDHERRRQALASKELDVDLDDEPEVPAETSDGHPLH